MYELVVESEFSAAHRLRGYQGPCENLHGHNWRVEMVVEGENLNDLGMVMDFRELKRVLNETLDDFDHKFLNELPCFAEQNPTTENVARIVFEEFSRKLPVGIRVRNVTVWESTECGARYSASPSA